LPREGEEPFGKPPIRTGTAGSHRFENHKAIKEYVMDHSIAVVARFKAMEGMDRKLKQLLLTLIEPSRSDEGCISYDLHQAINDPALFIFYEIWQSKEYLEKHSATSHVQHFRSKAKDLLAEPPELTLLAKISS
jgi:quinol monooxygenase YgiN